MSYIGNTPTSIAFLTDLFTGTGSLSVFTMSAAPASTSSILVSITGVLQEPSTYSVSGNTLTFSQAPPAGTGNISVRYLGIPASNIVSTAYRTVTDFTATLAQTIFTVPSYTVGYITVYRNGARLGAADYTATNGTTVVLTVAANTGDLVTTESFYVSSVLNAIPAVVGAVTSSYILDGAVGTAEIASGVTLSLPKVAGNIAVQGSTSGTCTLQAPAVAGSTVLTLPAVSGNVLTTTSGVAHTVQVFTSGSGTYTLPTNCKAIKVRMVGGGGTGGTGVSGCGGGGGAGGYLESLFATPSATYSYAVGAGGGVTTFGTALLTANNGSVGTAGTTGAQGGIGGSATGGNIVNSVGGTGGYGWAASPYYAGGWGAGSVFGTGGQNSGTNNGNGGPGYTYGSGGGGGVGGGSGAAGAAGIIIVEEYYV